MTVTIFVPRDSTALALGANETAAPSPKKQKRAASTSNWCATVRAACSGWNRWLKSRPTPAVSASVPIEEHEVAGLFDANFTTGGKHPKASALTEEIPYLKKQERLQFVRVGITDPVSLDDYLAHEGYVGLKKAIAMEPAAIVQEVTDSGLRGRGGAAFPTGIKWKTVLGAASRSKVHRL
jgi:formate dehydrogenase iron-sulfur subunit